MAVKLWTPKVVALTILGWAITVLILMSASLSWRHQFRQASYCLALGVALTFVFFRHRRIAFATTALSFLLINAGLIVPFRPTLLGITITVVSALGLYLLAVWETRRYPDMKRGDFKKFFDGDPE
jgi:hypothetical protein